MKGFFKTMILPIISAILGILACFYAFNLSFLGLLFLIPLFIFYIKENKLKNLIWGTLIFRILWGAGVAFSLFDPILFTLESVVILGLPVCIYFIKKSARKSSKSCNDSKVPIILLISLPFLWTFWEYLQARFNLIPSFILTSGNILGSSNFLGLAALGGYPLLIFFCALTNILGTVLALNFKRFNPKWRLNLCVLIALITLVFSVGQVSKIQLQKNALAYQAHKNILKVVAVSNNEYFDKKLQTNLLQNHWGGIDIPSQIQTEIDRLLKPLEEDLSHKEIDLLILPEHFIDLKSIENVLKIESGKELKKAYQRLAQKLKTNLAVVFANYQEGKRYNSTFLFDENELKEIHNKRHLTIKGEVFPLENGRPFYVRGKELKILKVKDVPFASAICLEIYYPNDMKKVKRLGAQFISCFISNRWADARLSLKEYLFLANNSKKITAVWLKMPIVSAGRNDYAGIYLPSGETQLINLSNLINSNKNDKNYAVFFGEIKYR